MSADLPQAQFNGWAKVEVMGHQSHIGYVRTEAYGAAVLFRIDTPELPEREYVLEEPSWAYEVSPDLRRWCREGTKVKRERVPGVSVLVGAGSIYRIVPCSEAAAMKAIESTMRTELMIMEIPPERALPAPADDDEDEDEEDSESDTCEDCHQPLELCVCPI